MTEVSQAISFLSQVDFRIPEFLTALLLACGFGLIGVLLTGVRQPTIWSCVESSLVGLGAVSTLFFPLGFVLGVHTLAVATILVAAAGFVALFLAGRRVLRPDAIESPREPPRPVEASQRNRWDLLAVLSWATILAATVQFCLLNLRLSFLWDGYQIWATKALVLYERGLLTKDLLVPGQPERMVGYPHLLPLYEGVLSKLLGHFTWNSIKPIFFLFVVALLVSGYRLASQFLNPRLALVATAIMASIPALGTEFSVGGYADMPLAAYITAMVASLTGKRASAGWRHPFPWLLGGTLLVKSEGMIPALICTLALVVWLVSQGRPSVVRTVGSHATALAVIGLSVGLRVGYLRWTHPEDLTYGPIDAAHIQKAAANFWLVVVTCGRYAFRVDEWGLLWPAFLIGSVLLLARGTRAERTISLSCLSTLAAYSGIFLFTNWPVDLQIDEAYDRLLTQIAPIAVIVVVTAWARGREGWIQRPAARAIRLSEARVR